MKTRNNRKLIIYALAIMLTITSVAYAALSATLNIQGTVTKQKGSWKIHFTDLKDPVIKGSATSTVNNFEVTYFNFAVTVKKPGDSVVYKFNVKNEGTIDAELYDVQLNGVTEAKEEDIIYTLTYDDTNKTALAKGDTLASGETKALILTVEFDEDAESVSDTNTQLNLSAMLTYVQSTNEEPDQGVDLPGTTDEPWVYSGAIASGNTNGKVVYYNPETAKECTETEYNSNTSQNTGCLKWYAYDENLNGYMDEYAWQNYNDYGTVDLLLSDAIGGSYVWGEEARNGLATQTSTWLANLGPRLLSVYDFTKLEGIDGLDAVATGSDYTPVNNWLYGTPYWISYDVMSVTDVSYWNGEGVAIVSIDYVSPGSEGASYGIRPTITVPVRK